MKKIVRLVHAPSITETGVIARIVQFEDGSGQVQTYGKRDGWQKGGTTIMSLVVTEEPTLDLLKARGLTPEQIEEVLFDPEK